MMLEICNNFSINEHEFIELDKKFGKLCWFVSHELKRKNSKNNCTEEAEDIKQDLLISMMRAGSYTKRQVYIEKCLLVANKYVKDDFVKSIIQELENLWSNRTKHGANRQKYGPHQEELLESIIRQSVPEVERPDKKAPLKIDTKFSTYCKSIVWNTQKAHGRQISKMKFIRNNQVSLSENGHLL